MKVSSQDLLPRKKERPVNELTPKQKEMQAVKARLKAKFGDKVDISKNKKPESEKLTPDQAEEKSTKVSRDAMLMDALKTDSFQFNDKERRVLGEILSK